MPSFVFLCLSHTQTQTHIYTDTFVIDALQPFGNTNRYFNALAFGPLMTAYLVTRGMSFASIGVWSGIASATGMFGTAFYARSIRITSVENTGMWSLSLQFFCLTFSFASSFVANPAVSSALLIGGVIVSRIGRWVFEVALVQLMQTYVPAEVRGTVGGVHSALYSFSALLAFVLGLVFPDPNQFWIFVWSGYGVVGIALLLYAFGV